MRTIKVPNGNKMRYHLVIREPKEPEHWRFYRVTWQSIRIKIRRNGVCRGGRGRASDAIYHSVRRAVNVACGDMQDLWVMSEDIEHRIRILQVLYIHMFNAHTERRVV